MVIEFPVESIQHMNYLDIYMHLEHSSVYQQDIQVLEYFINMHYNPDMKKVLLSVNTNGGQIVSVNMVS